MQELIRVDVSVDKRDVYVGERWDEFIVNASSVIFESFVLHKKSYGAKKDKIKKL